MIHSSQRRWAPMLRALAAVLAVVLLAAACGGGSSDPLTPVTVQRYLDVREATDNLARVTNLMATAELTSHQLETQRMTPAGVHRLVMGAEIGWNNVEVALDGFTPTQAGAIPALGPMVTGVRSTAIAWGTALGKLHDGDSPAQIAKALSSLERQDGSDRNLITAAALALARSACSLERAHSQFASPAATRGDCAAAARLAAAT